MTDMQGARDRTTQRIDARPVSRQKRRWALVANSAGISVGTLGPSPGSRRFAAFIRSVEGARPL